MPADDRSRIQNIFHQQNDRMKFIRNLIKTSQMCKIRKKKYKICPSSPSANLRKRELTRIFYYFLCKNSMGYFFHLENSKCSKVSPVP